MRKNVVVVAVLLGATLTGCARIVVLDPELAARENSKDWTVTGEPGKPAAAPAAPAPASGEAPKK